MITNYHEYQYRRDERNKLRNEFEDVRTSHMRAVAIKREMNTIDSELQDYETLIKTKMATNNVVTATIAASNKPVEVYRLKKGGWCNATDCKTEYTDDELIFNNK